MGSDGQTAHHWPSPAILMLFFTIAQNQKYWVKFAQNYPKRFWNVWKIDKSPEKCILPLKIWLKSDKKPLVVKEGYKRTVRATDGQWWAVCPSLPITGQDFRHILFLHSLWRKCVSTKSICYRKFSTKRSLKRNLYQTKFDRNLYRKSIGRNNLPKTVKSLSKQCPKKPLPTHLRTKMFRKNLRTNFGRTNYSNKTLKRT